MNSLILWAVFIAAGAFALLRKRGFAFEAMSAALCAAGVLLGLALGFSLREIVPPLLLAAALSLFERGGGEK